MSNATAAQKRFWGSLATLGCLICQRPAQIAHAHSGSVRERTNEVKAKGKKLQRMNWLCLPLCPACHTELDAGVVRFEAKHGTQAEMIDRLCELFNMPLWEMAKGSKVSLPPMPVVTNQEMR